MIGVGGFCNPVLTSKVATKTGFSFQEMNSYIIQNTHSRATLNVTRRLYGLFDQFILQQR